MIGFSTNNFTILDNTLLQLLLNFIWILITVGAMPGLFAGITQRFVLFGGGI